MKKHFARLAAALVTVLASIATAQEIQYEKRLYAVIELGNLGEERLSTARGVNSHGVVAGSSYVSIDPFLYHPMIWRNGVMRDLDPGLFDDGQAFGINDNEQIVGRARFDSNFDWHAFLWEDGVMTDLGTLGGRASEALAINEHGDIVGFAYVTGDASAPPVIWENGAIRSLMPSCQDCSGHARGINDHGQIVGHVSMPEQGVDQQPVVWDTAGNLTILSDERGTAHDINNLGQIVGSEGGSTRRAVRWETDGTMIVLDDGGPWNSVAIDINDHGIIIGGDGTAAGRSVIWTPDGTRYTLNYLTAPRNKWRIDSVYDINNSNQIVGRGRIDNGNPRLFAFLLTPVTPKFEITELTPAIAGEMNEITARGENLEPGMRVNFYWGVHGGGTMFPTHSCDILDAVLQIENAKWTGSAIVDENRVATLRGTVPAIAKDEIILFQAMVPASSTADSKCMQSSFVIVQFE